MIAQILRGQVKLCTQGANDIICRNWTINQPAGLDPCSTDQDGSVHLVSVGFDLCVGHRVIVQHRLQVGPVRREVREQHPLYSLPGNTQSTSGK